MRKKSEIDAKAVNRRIKKLREGKFGKRGKSEFARRLGLSVSTYNYYEQDRLPPVDVLAGICRVTGISLNWLIFGEQEAPGLEKGEEQPPGRVTSDNNSGDSIQGSVFSGGKTGGELASKIEKLAEIAPETTDQLERFADLLFEKAKLEGKITGEREDKPDIGKDKEGGESLRSGGENVVDKNLIPVLGRTAAGIVHFWDESVFSRPGEVVTELEELVRKHIGKSITRGYDGQVTTEEQLESGLGEMEGLAANLVQVKSDDVEKGVEFIECAEIQSRYPDCFALQIDGNSMSPRINDGDVVILSPSVSAGQGQICVAKLKGQIGVTCKIIRTTEDSVHLIPINEKYQTQAVGSNDLLWALAVLGCFRT